MPDFGSTQQPIIAGTNDADNPSRNATVFVNSGLGVSGSGTLIAPDVVISAGHVFASHSNLPPGQTARAGNCDWEIPGQWYSFPNHWAGNLPTVQIGPDEGAPRITENIIAYAIPDCADVIALQLANPVPSNVARPARIATRPIDLSDIDTLDIAGYGLTSAVGQPGVDATFRQFATLNGPFEDHPTRLGHVETDGEASGVQSGDSGGPVYLGGTNTLVGVVRQTGVNMYSNWTSTWADPLISRNNRMPPVAPFLSRIRDCASYRAAGLPQVDSPDPDDVIPIFNWWHRGREDNFLSSDPRWSEDVTRLTFSGEHLVNGPTREQYKMYRLDGFVAHPRRPQPRGTVPLFSWWNRARGDNFCSTDPRWSMEPRSVAWRGNHISNGPQKEGYRLYRMEGYIFDPKEPQPDGTLPLFSWWHPDRGDNFTTTDPRYVMNPSAIRWNGEHLANGRSRGGYRMYRLEGYVYDRRIVEGYNTQPI